MLPLLMPHTAFPPLESALDEPNGLLAAGGDLSPERILTAYRAGIFPWFNEDDPILWWSPNPRMVLFPNELKISRSLKKTLRNKPYEVRVDSAFSQVMHACAAPRKDQLGTWIHPEMVKAYTTLHEMGFAHSIETWMDDELVGGLYGLALGKIFFGESMFSRQPDVSKIALVHLVEQLKNWGFGLIDCQVNTTHLASLGARDISRKEFSQKLSTFITDTEPEQSKKWNFEKLSVE